MNTHELAEVSPTESDWEAGCWAGIRRDMERDLMARVDREDDDEREG